MKFRTVSMFVTVDLQTEFHTQFVRMFALYRQTNFNIPSCNDPLVITVKSESQVEFLHGRIVVLYSTKHYLKF